MIFNLISAWISRSDTSLRDFKVLSTPINVISHSKEVLIYMGVYKDLQIELSAVCLQEMDILSSSL